VGFETENCSGSIAYTQVLVRTFRPDYIVGSVHHVKDIAFDYSQAHYQAACEQCGGIDGLYLTYLDEQYEMVRTLSPQVVGHFDIVRIYDPDYRSRLTSPPIWEKIVRNLALIKQLDLILDFNLRPLARGESEAYLSAPILNQAREMGIDIVPGDDSHGVETIGAHMQTAIAMLQSAGVSTAWRTPVDTAR
jgi:histidinol-phosphatase (PHP family)